jgi:hypothetical protein
VHLVRGDENDRWRFSLPNSLSGEDFAERLTKSMEELADMRDRMPKDRDEGYSMVLTRALYVMHRADNERQADTRDR